MTNKLKKVWFEMKVSIMFYTFLACCFIASPYIVYRCLKYGLNDINLEKETFSSVKQSIRDGLKDRKITKAENELRRAMDNK